VRVTIACLLVSVAAFAQDRRPLPLRGPEELPLVRALDDAVRRRRGPDMWVRWDGHFLQGGNGQTYVPYTVRLEGVGDAYRSTAVSVRVLGWNYAFSDSFSVEAERDGDDRVIRGAMMVQPGRCTVYVAVQDRSGRSSRVSVSERVIVVPGFGKGLRLSSVIVVGRVEPVAQPLTQVDRRANPYALGPVVLHPVRSNDFTQRDVLTVAFQVYNPAMFDDGRPDVEVGYRVFRQDGDRAPVGATAPQLFDQESLPEEFSLKAGHQLTPVQSLPLSQFPPGKYRLQINVQDHLGRANTQAEVSFTVHP
jgi:hypothetical protein